MSKTFLRNERSEDMGTSKIFEYSLVKGDHKVWKIRLTSVSSDPTQSLMNPHLSQYGKMCFETKSTGYVCPVCNLDIDEYGYCGCGAGSS
ncbi:hypothetical protein [Metallosphaera hakonensis]|uniref:Uncharacterized protein n=1 Tax=Metallosphaera hakonensis JCM 8857 = DSM 7519 TaxID=1293036 RepID=A0A2U9IT30_9CREN|nr:hypothetical protein [Metallosphaera hakonensis]AWR99067.1 hypothetical protein DFR87_04460 [Metallosphaera hakonensis JCM 8857 = DSM 7519]